MEKNLWNTTQSLLVVYNYENLDRLHDFRKSLDKMLANSVVDRVIIIVNIDKEVDKNTLPPHFLIYYNSPNDYNFWGKLKDIQLDAELRKQYDTLLWLGETDKRSFKFVKNIKFSNKIGVNSADAFFELHLNSESDIPSEMLTFVVETLKKITLA
ncbi:MAG: hypothetical protein FGM14_12900 [Flavobacteriales bacterium]|nr:hypothetical protein [Flavobacteriales bacterium]